VEHPAIPPPITTTFASWGNDLILIF